MNDEDPFPAPRRKLAIIGTGSSGLISLKFAIDELVDWDIVAFEHTDSVVGRWGRPYPGFVSTSTKFTTQFASYPKYDAGVNEDGGSSRAEFFREGEYGDYLLEFANEFSLSEKIKFRHSLRAIRWDEQDLRWKLTIQSLVEGESPSTEESFDAVILCSGLHAEPKPIDVDIPTVPTQQLFMKDGLEQIRNRKVVVMGGGESGVDHAVRLAKPELNNQVFLSLQSGIRVSPRYHPIRGVPSDFLRNRLLLSIHENLRNRIGQKFVELRIRYEDTFRRWFPAKKLVAKNALSPTANPGDVAARRKAWTWKLTQTAKDDLFNMFHNKSDDFLEHVARGTIQIVGKPVDRNANEFFGYQSADRVAIAPDLVVPSVGFRPTLESLSNGAIRLEDFYLGCLSIRFPNLFAVGFARPIIGNIPSMSEMQAAYIVGLLSGRVQPESNIAERHRQQSLIRKERYSMLNQELIYPVEMFPYCDQLARLMNRYPTLADIGSMQAWLRMHLAPASTIHYFLHDPKARQAIERIPICMPSLLVAFLVLLKPIDFLYRISLGWKFARRGGGAD
ncbi:MAG: hypothetical protein ABL921_02425 [Pirellula sp.]